jgi:alkanesulfonate monooxygenase SsuD/methylene tetrahydromethanopterin reductase-like flavin-dependent oxidoreductase (luciferase family)
MVTIDHISNGRLEVGIGAGWHQPEYDAYGIPFESPAVRLRRLEEAVEVIRLLWTEQVANYSGEFFTLNDAWCEPKPIQDMPRIWIGAAQPKALALAGRISDAWNTSAVTPQQFAERLEIVKSASPNPDELQTGLNLQVVSSGSEGLDVNLQKRLYDPSVPRLMESLLIADDMDAVGERFQEYVDAGVQWLILTARAPFQTDWIVRIAEEVIPKFRAQRRG